MPRMVQLFEAGSEGRQPDLRRGSVVVEPRTNSLIITETAPKLAEIRGLIELVDIPIRQVMIEASIVIAQSDATKTWVLNGAAPAWIPTTTISHPSPAIPRTWST